MKISDEAKALTSTIFFAVEQSTREELIQRTFDSIDALAWNRGIEYAINLLLDSDPKTSLEDLAAGLEYMKVPE